MAKICIGQQIHLTFRCQGMHVKQSIILELQYILMALRGQNMSKLSSLMIIFVCGVVNGCENEMIPVIFSTDVEILSS